MWKTTRFYLHLSFAFLRKYRLFILFSLLTGAAGFWAFPRALAYMPKFRTIETIGIIGQYNQNNLPAEILTKVSLGLTQIDDQGQPYPGLAKKWSTGGEGKEWLFELDDQLVWSDEQPIKASEISYNFNDVEIEYPADNQILFRLQDPFSPFPSVVSHPVLRKDDLIGIGPYKFSQIKTIGQYYQTITLTPVTKTSSLPNLRYNFYGTESAAITAFKLGEIRKIIDLINADEFRNWPRVTISENPHASRYVGLFFNLDKPDFKDKAPRQALAYAISDKSFGRERVISPIMPTSWGYNPHIKPYEYDLERAKNLWGEFSDEQRPIQISTVPSLLDVAETVAQDWQEFGVPTEVRVINTIPEDFDILLVTQEVPADPDQYVLWHSTQQTNITGYQNPKIDKLLEDGRKELDPDARLEIYQDFQRTLLEDLPVIFLFRPVTYTVSRD